MKSYCAFLELINLMNRGITSWSRLRISWMAKTSNRSAISAKTSMASGLLNLSWPKTWILNVAMRTTSSSPKFAVARVVVGAVLLELGSAVISTMSQPVEDINKIADNSQWWMKWRWVVWKRGVCTTECLHADVGQIEPQVAARGGGGG